MTQTTTAPETLKRPMSAALEQLCALAFTDGPRAERVTAAFDLRVLGDRYTDAGRTLVDEFLANKWGNPLLEKVLSETIAETA